MKVIVVVFDPPRVQYVVPNPEKYGEGKLPYEQCAAMQKYIAQGVQWFVEDSENLPERIYKENVYYDGSSVRLDEGWNQCLMPDFLIKEKTINSHQSELDAELEKPSPDPIVAIKLNREIEKAKGKSDPQMIAQMALEGLDKRIEKGEPDKTIIRQKLIARIALLEAQKLQEQNK